MYSKAFCIFLSLLWFQKAQSMLKTKENKQKNTHTHTHQHRGKFTLCICCSELNKFGCIWIKYSEILRKSGIFLKCHSCDKDSSSLTLHCTTRDECCDSKMHIMALAILPRICTQVKRTKPVCTHITHMTKSNTWQKTIYVTHMMYFHFTSEKLKCLIMEIQRDRNYLQTGEVRKKYALNLIIFLKMSYEREWIMNKSILK